MDPDISFLPPPMRHALVVIGSHRSGTSAVTRSLSLMGAALPRDVMPAASGNPLGHWEPLPIVDLNDEILAAAGARWDDPDPFLTDKPAVEFAARYHTRARDLVRHQYGCQKLIVVKDPRISLMTDLWRRALADEGYASTWLVMVRDPEDVAASLAVRNGIARDDAYHLWTKYMMSADQGTADLPRLFCTYKALIEDPERTLDRIGGILPSPPSKLAYAAARTFLDARHRNHAGTGNSQPVNMPEPLLVLRSRMLALAHDADCPAGPVAEDWPAPSLTTDLMPRRRPWLEREAEADDVRNLYRLLLGRDPENEDVIAMRIGYPVKPLIREFLSSPEFKINTVGPALNPLAPAESRPDPSWPWLGAWATGRFGLDESVADTPRRFDLLARVFESDVFGATFTTEDEDDRSWSFQAVAAGLRALEARIAHASAAEGATPGIETVKAPKFAPNQEVALVIARSITGAVLPHPARLAQHLMDQGILVLLVIMSNCPVRVRGSLLSRLAGVLIMPPAGSGFEIWAKVIERHPELLAAPMLYLADDTMVPVSSTDAFGTAIRNLKSLGTDLAGFTQSFADGWHIESYFLALRSRLLGHLPFHTFLASMTPAHGHAAHRLTTLVEASGMTVGVVFDAEGDTSPSRRHWEHMIGTDLPFLPTALLDNGAAKYFVEEHGDRLERSGFCTATLMRIGLMLDERPAGGEASRLSAHPPARVMPPYRITYHGRWDGPDASLSRALVRAIASSGAHLNLRPMQIADAAGSASCAIGSTDFTGDADIVIIHPLDRMDNIPEHDKPGIQRASRRIFCCESGIPADWSDRLGVDQTWWQNDAQPHGAVHCLTVPHPDDSVSLKAFVAKAFGSVLDASPMAMTEMRSVTPRRAMIDVVPGIAEGLFMLPLTEDGAILPMKSDAAGFACHEWIILAPLGTRLFGGIGDVVRSHVAANPGVDIFYADDVCRGPSGGQDDVRLKPDFDPILLSAQDYVGAPVLIRSTAWIALGGLNAAMDTAGIADLLFRATDAGFAIRRIPQVLLEHRVRRVFADQDDYRRMLTTQRSLSAYRIERGRAPGTCVLHRRFDAHIPDVTLIVPTCRTQTPDGTPRIKALLESIARTQWPMDRLSVLVGDDHPDRPSFAARDWPFALEWTYTPRSTAEAFNYSRKMNHLWRRADSEYIVFLNDDVEAIDPCWLRALLTFAMDERVGGVGARLLMSDGRIQHVAHIPYHSTVSHAWYGQPADLPTYQHWSLVHRCWPAVTGAVFATRRSILHEIDGFDERFSLEFNDVDLCLRIRRMGLLIVSAPDAEMRHVEKASRGTALPPADEVHLFHRRWADALKDDATWHPLLRNDTIVMAPVSPFPL